MLPSLQLYLPAFDAKVAQLHDLEKVLARYGTDVPRNLQVEYDTLCRETAKLEQRRARAPQRNTGVPAEQVIPKLTSRQRSSLEKPIIESLADFSKTLSQLTDDLPSIQPPAAVAARRYIDQGHTAYADLTREWERLRPIAQAPDRAIYAFIHQLNDAYAQLHILELRHIHRLNLGTIEQQLAAQQSNILVDRARANLEQTINYEQQAIQRIERQRWQSASDRELVAIHRRNLQWYHEMLAGIRPVVPVKQLHDFLAEEKAIREIDRQLALSQGS